MARLDRAQLYEQLDNGSVDLAIGGHLAPPKRMLSERLYDESFVCIADQRHPLRAASWTWNAIWPCPTPCSRPATTARRAAWSTPA